MKWMQLPHWLKDKVDAFVHYFGPTAKFVVGVVSNLTLPAPVAAVVFGLVECAIDTTKELTEANDKDLARAVAVLKVMRTDLGDVLDQVATLRHASEEDAKAFFQEILRVDDKCQAALRKLAFLGKRFDCLEKHMRKLLEGQAASAKNVEQVLAMLQQLPGVADYIDELRRCGLNPSDFRKRLDAFGEGIKALAEGRFQEAAKVLGGVEGQNQSAVIQQALAGVQEALDDNVAAEDSRKRADSLRLHESSLQEILPLLRKVRKRVGVIADAVNELQGGVHIKYPKDFQKRFWDPVRCAVGGCLLGGAIGLALWGLARLILLEFGLSWGLGGWIASGTGVGEWSDWVVIGGAASGVLGFLAGAKYFEAAGGTATGVGVGAFWGPIGALLVWAFCLVGLLLGKGGLPAWNLWATWGAMIGGGAGAVGGLIAWLAGWYER